MNEEELRAFRTRFGIPISDAEVGKTRSTARRRQHRNQRMREKRKALGGYVPTRKGALKKPAAPDIFEEFRKGNEAESVATMYSCGRCRSRCATRKSATSSCRSFPTKRARLVEALFRQVGTHCTPARCRPVDMDTLLYYKEASDGQSSRKGSRPDRCLVHLRRHRDARREHDSVLHLLLDVRLQRIGDPIRAAGDRARGFLLGGTSGRTTLAGEGLQHQDGNSQLLALAYPNCVAMTRRSPTRSRSSSRTASSGYVDQKASLLPDGDERADACPKCPRVRRTES
jgi:pyruvate dehydrogenase E1 component